MGGKLLNIYQNKISIAKVAQKCDYYVTGIDLDCWTLDKSLACSTCSATSLGWEQRLLKYEPETFKFIWAQTDLRKPQTEAHIKNIIEHLKPKGWCIQHIKEPLSDGDTEEIIRI